MKAVRENETEGNWKKKIKYLLNIFLKFVNWEIMRNQKKLEGKLLKSWYFLNFQEIQGKKERYSRRIAKKKKL